MGMRREISLLMCTEQVSGGSAQLVDHEAGS